MSVALLSQQTFSQQGGRIQLAEEQGRTKACQSRVQRSSSSSRSTSGPREIETRNPKHLGSQKLLRMGAAAVV